MANRCKTIDRFSRNSPLETDLHQVAHTPLLTLARSRTNSIDTGPPADMTLLLSRSIRQAIYPRARKKADAERRLKIPAIPRARPEPERPALLHPSPGACVLATGSTHLTTI
jgi:hypothetical protein